MPSQAFEAQQNSHYNAPQRGRPDTQFKHWTLRLWKEALDMKNYTAQRFSPFQSYYDEKMW